MRIEELHLERFGHFDDLRLDFSGDDVRLHMIYGPNEAGKSTALAAICDVLFGIRERTPYNFLHEYSRLRIGATIRNAAGQQLAFKRRKARGNSLLKPDESGELPADSLVPFLGGATEDFFTRMFGLNHSRLREGGKGMLEAGGDIARSLFEAGAGTAHLSTVVKQLSDDADAIGAPTRKASAKPYWQAHDRYEKANSRVRDETLRVNDWTAADKAVTEARARLRDAEDAQADSRKEQSALERIRRVAPILRRIDDFQVRLDALGDGIELPEGFAETWQQAIKAFDDVSAEVARSEATIKELRDDLQKLGTADPWPFAGRSDHGADDGAWGLQGKAQRCATPGARSRTWLGTGRGPSEEAGSDHPTTGDRRSGADHSVQRADQILDRGVEPARGQTSNGSR